MGHKRFKRFGFRLIAGVLILGLGLPWPVVAPARAAVIPTGGLQVWLDAANVDGGNNATVSAGSPFAPWINLSSDAAAIGDFDLAAASTRWPTLQTVTINGLTASVGRFDGIDDVLWTGTSLADSLDADMTLFAVTDSRQSGQGAIVSTRRSTTGWALRYQDPTNLLYYHNNVGTSLIPNNLIVDDFHVTQLVRQGSAASADVGLGNDDGIPNSKTIDAFTATGNSGTMIARNYDSSNYLAGDFAELIVYDRVLSDTEMGQVGTYLGAKYGINMNRAAEYQLPGVAAFDLDDSAGSPTQSGFTRIDDNPPFSATDSGVTLTVTNPAAQDRDRGLSGGGGDLTGHPQADLLRDFSYTVAPYSTSLPASALNLDVSGLEPDTEYLLRVHSHDRQVGDRAVSLWYQDPVNLDFNNNEALVTAHQNLSTIPDAGYVDMRLTTNGAGELNVVGAASPGTVSGASVIGYFNGLEIFELPADFADVIKVDMDNTNGGGGPTNRTAPGFEALTLSAPGSTTGSMHSNGVTVSVSTDRTDTPTRHRNNSGEDLVADFVFANDDLDVQIDGLVPGANYEITIFSQDTSHNSMSSWFLDGSNIPFKAAHPSYGSGSTNLDAASFSVFVTPSSPSLTISAREIAGRPDILYFNGLVIRGDVQYEGVDYGETGQWTQAGFRGQNGPHAGGPTPLTTPYNTTLFDGTRALIDVTVEEIGDTGNVGLEFRDRPGAGEGEVTGTGLDDLLGDLVATRGGLLRLTLSGLPDGAYQFTGYHNDASTFNEGFATGSLFDVLVDGALRDTVDASNETGPTSLEAIATSEFFFRALTGQDVVIDFQSTSAAATGFIPLSGFQLTAVPEPGAIILLGLGALGLLSMFRRRRR